LFGIYRTLLALFVVASHLMSITVIGQYAVHGFFILSGYLMTHIMSRNYGYDLAGIRAFGVNRFLRLYPTYWVLCAFVMPILFFAGQSATHEFNYNMGIPGDAAIWLQNLTMVYLNVMPMQINPRLSPPTWALTVEILFYALIAIGLSKTKLRTLIWAGLSVAYISATHWFELENSYRYSAIMAGSLPFAAGAILYHFRDIMEVHIGWLKTRMGLGLVVALFLLNCFSGCLVVLLGLNEAIGHICYYLNLLLNFALIFALADGVPFSFPKKVDTIIGDYSYPIYLFHYPAGLAASMILFGTPQRGFHLDGFLVMCTSLPLCFLASYFVIRFIDHPIQRIRARVKKRLRSTEASPP
jgi:peptidoglycan/LPS O-acetylase OafA/YrhL